MTYNILHDLYIPCPKGCTGPKDAHTNMGPCNGCISGRIHFRPNCTLYLDMDGFLFDFNQRFFDLFGVWPRDVTDNQLWASINTRDDFFADMPLMRGALDFFRYVQPLGPQILTACPNSNYRIAALQKKHAVRKNLPGNPVVLPVNGGKNKGLFMHMTGDILIDDYGRNIDCWEELGGVGIKHVGEDFESTRQALVNILIEKHLHRQ